MPVDFIEIKIPVPYGYIAAKAWGDEHSPIKILALHGWQDNAGTFDQIIPHLPENSYVVALDLPGHGLSSHIPPGCAYHDMFFMMEIKRVTDYLYFDKYTILGHSMGAAIGLYYACIFPQNVQRVITIDMIKPLSFPPEELAKRTSDGIKFFLDLEQKNNNPPVYDHQTTREKLISSHRNYGEITPIAADCLLKRGTKTTDDGKGEIFTRDNRLKAVLFQRLDNNALLNYLRNIECELCIIKAKNGIKLDPDEINDKFIELYKKKCKKFKYVYVEGGHHVHLCQPDNVAPIINEFINIQSDNNNDYDSR